MENGESVNVLCRAMIVIESKESVNVL